VATYQGDGDSHSISFTPPTPGSRLILVVTAWFSVDSAEDASGPWVEDESLLGPVGRLHARLLEEVGGSMMRAAVFAILVAGCLPDDPMELADLPCPTTGTTLTYASFGHGFMADHCNTCHATSRAGAPSSVKFGTHAEVQRHAARIFVRAAGPNVSMPPGPDDPPEIERDRLAEWLACGAP
jgi:hypothetical protein